MNTSLLRYGIPALLLCCAGAGCSTDTSASDAQAKVDSIVIAKTSKLKADMKRTNDSLINAKALERADSIMPVSKIAAQAGK